MDFQRTDSMNDLLPSGGNTTDTTTKTVSAVNNITVEKNITSKIEENIVVPIKNLNDKESINKEPINKENKKKKKKKIQIQKKTMYLWNM